MPSWTLVQRRLHWSVALLVLGQYLLQRPMRAAVEAAEKGDAITFVQFLVTTLHTWGGAGIAVLVLWRLVLRRRAAVPVGAGMLGPRTARLVVVHHRLLYALLLLMALSGSAHYYLGWAPAARWHEIGKWLLAAFVALHLAGALRHGLRPGEAILQRLWRGPRKRSD